MQSQFYLRVNTSKQVAGGGNYNQVRRRIVTDAMIHKETNDPALNQNVDWLVALSFQRLA